MSVSFTDEGEDVMREKGYTVDQSKMGKVYYKAEGIAIHETISVNYMEYPWLSCFEVKGADIVKNEKEGN